MRIVVVGATGWIGEGICDLVSANHSRFSAGALNLVRLSRSSRPALDGLDDRSVEQAFADTGPFDALVVAFGETLWDADPSLDDFRCSIEKKALAQIRCALKAVPHLTEGGSMTLCSGIVGSIPSPGGAPSAAANAVLESFVRCWETPRRAGFRINVVRSPLVSEALDAYGASFPGQVHLARDQALVPVLRSIYGVETGRVLAPYDGLSIEC